MLSPDYLLKISDGAESIAARMHTEILKKIITRIMRREAKGYNYLLTAQDKWAIQSLEEAGYLLSDIQQEIATYTGYQADEIKQAMEDAGVTALKYDDKTYEQAGMSPPPLQESPYMVRVMQRGYESTMGTWKNFTRTTANASEKLFINTLDKIYAQVQGGAVSYTKAYMDAIDEICKDGIVITYPSGHVDTVETATLRCVRTGITQTTAEIELARMEEMGWDLVIVSSHQGARPSHQVWQGKIYSRSGKSDKYPDFVSSTHYGEGNGLCGWNCRHHFGPYLEGNENPYKNYSNKENIELYEKTQQQRALERAVRKSTRKMEAYKAALDGCQDDEMRGYLEKRYKDARAEVRAGRQEYKEFCEQEGFRPLPERMRIAKEGKLGEKYSGPDILEVKPPRRETPIVPKEQPEPTGTFNPQKDYSPNNSDKAGVKQEYAKMVNACGDEDVIRMLATYGDNPGYYYDENRAFYEPPTNTVHWHEEEGIEALIRGKYSIIAHEMGHACDSAMIDAGKDRGSRRDAIEAAMRKTGIQDIDIFVPKAKPSQNDRFINAMRSDIEALRKNGIPEEDVDRIITGKNTTGFQDFLDGAFGVQGKTKKGLNIPSVMYGHGERYYNRKYDTLIGHVDEVLKEVKFRGYELTKDDLKERLRNYETASELWAHLTSATVTGKTDPAALELFKKYCPNALKEYKALVKEYTKEAKKADSKQAKKTDNKQSPALPTMAPTRRQNRTEYNPDEHLYHASETFGPLSSKEMKELVEGCGNRDNIELYNTWGDVPRYSYASDGTSYYDPSEDRVFWAYDREEGNRYKTLAHESGHAFDFHMDSIGIDDYETADKIDGIQEILGKRPSQSDSFVKAVIKDIENLEKAGKLDTEDIELIAKHIGTAGFEDFLDGAFGGKGPWPEIISGHGEEYYNRRYKMLADGDNVELVLKALEGGDIKTADDLKKRLRAYETASELWANINAGITLESDEEEHTLELFEKYCPNAVKEYKRHVKAHLKAMEGREKPTRQADGLAARLSAPNGITLNATARKKEQSDLEDFRKARERNRKKFTMEDDFLPSERGLVQKREANKRFRDMITNCGDPDIIEFFNIWTDTVNYEYLGPERVGGDDDDTACFNRKTNTVKYNYSYQRADYGSIFETLTHEMGHAFDYASANWGTGKYKVMEALHDAMAPFTPDGYNLYHRPSQSDYFMGAMFEDINRITAERLDDDAAKKIKKHKCTSGFEDFLDGAFGQRTNKYPWLPEIKWGHGEEYYNRKFDKLGIFKSTVLSALKTQYGIDLGSEEKLAETLRGYETASELWANITSAFATANDDGGEAKAMFEKYCPSSVAAYKKLIKEHLEAMAKEEEEAARAHDEKRRNH